MPDQAEGLRHKRKNAQVLSVLALPGLRQMGSHSAQGMTQAWHSLGVSVLLIDRVGVSARGLLGCHPLHNYAGSSGKSLKDTVLVQHGSSAVIAEDCLAGDGQLIREASALGYGGLVFDAGELDEEDVPIEVSAEQDILLLASAAGIERVYALLKSLAHAGSPARVWLLWDGRSEASSRLVKLCAARLGRVPFFFGAPNLSRMGHVFERDCLSMSLQDNDFLAIVTTMVSKQSVRGEETPARTKRHA